MQNNFSCKVIFSSYFQLLGKRENEIFG